MLYVPPYALMTRWLDNCETTDTSRLKLSYDDLLDVLKGLLLAVPVDEVWYTAEYPAVATLIAQSPTETPTSHFQKNGYFEGRRPFDPGWQDLTSPVPFEELQKTLKIVPKRGHLWIEITRVDLLELVSEVLQAVPVDEVWYQANYPDVTSVISAGQYRSAADHYARRGYFSGWFPSDIEVDEEWYVSHYEHVRIGLKCGVAVSAKDHFIHLGYNEGCRPIAPPIGP